MARRLTEDELAEAMDKIEAAADVWTAKVNLAQVVPELSVTQFDRAFNLLRDAGRIRKRGNSKTAAWKACTKAQHNGAGSITLPSAIVAATMTQPDRELVDRFLLAVVNAGSIDRARVAFDAAVQKLEALRG